MRIHSVFLPEVLMNVKVSWLLSRLRRLLPLIVLAILIFMFYSMSSRPIAKAISTLPPPPTPPSIANHWVIINATDGSICSSLVSEFYHWTVLLVSVRTIPKYSHSSCIFLSVEDLDSFGQRYAIKHLRRMALAYLYAISHGAAIIYVPASGGDLTLLQRPPHPLLGNSRLPGLVFNATNTFDPASHFGCKFDKQRPSEYSLSSNYIPAIHTPAVLDWISIPYCPTLEPPVTLANGTYTNFSLEGSAFTRDAFWSLPVVDWLEEDTERSLWNQQVQWLLWQIGKTIRVYWDDLYPKTINSQKFSFVSNGEHHIQKCDGSKFETCVKRILSTFSDKTRLQAAVLEWFDVLERVGYAFPKLLQHSTSNSNDDSSSTVWFHPVKHYQPTTVNTRSQKKFVPIMNVNSSRKLFDATCRQRKLTPLISQHQQSFTWEIAVDFSRPWYQFHDILLVVVFNTAHYEIIPLLEILYRSFFPNILFCGPELPDLKAFPNLAGYEFSFVTFDHGTKDKVPGSLNYECTIKATQMRYQVDGYLVIADDLLLLINPLTSLPRNVVWHIPENELRVGDLLTLRECRLGMCDFHPHWHWWEDYASATLKLLRAFKQEQWNSPLLHHCYSELVRLNGAEFRANGGFSDVYYIPTRLAEDFAELAQMFLKEKVFLELAVPTIVRCLELSEDIRPLPGKAVWDFDRNETWKYFVRHHMYGKTYLHPAKWSGVINNSVPELISLYCDHAVPYQFDPYGRFKL